MSEQNGNQQEELHNEHTGHEHDHDHDHHMSPCSTMERFNTKDLIVREDILQKAQELASLLSTSEEVQFYQRAEQQIQSSDHVQKLIKLIKKKQKEAVAFESFDNPEMVKKIEDEIEQLQNELDAIPIVSEFQQSQSDINYLLQLVMGIVRDTVSEKIELEKA